MLALELDEEPLRTLPLEAQIAACRATAADDRQPGFFRVRARFVFANVDERSNHDVCSIVGHELRGHRFQCAGEKQIEEQRLDEIVGVMAERDLVRAHLFRNPIEDAAPQPRAQGARCRVGVEQIVHHFADGRVLDAVLPSAIATGRGEELVLVFLVARIDVHRDE